MMKCLLTGKTFFVRSEVLETGRLALALNPPVTRGEALRQDLSVRQTGPGKVSPGS